MASFASARALHVAMFQVIIVAEPQTVESVVGETCSVADPGRGARGARYPSKKKYEKWNTYSVDLVHDELKREPYEDADVEVGWRFQES